MVDILDAQFEKGKCKERGKALVMLSYIEMMLQGIRFNKDGIPKPGSRKKVYCRKCGKELSQIRIPAEEVWEYYGDSRYSAYDPETGERQWGIKFICPLKKWYNSHISYTEFLGEL